MMMVRVVISHFLDVLVSNAVVLVHAPADVISTVEHDYRVPFELRALNTAAIGRN